MKVTDIRIRKVEGEGKLKAVVSITIDGEFVIHDIRLVASEHGLFVAMPSRRTREGGYKDIAHPIKSETRCMMETMILNQYREYLKRGIL